MDAVPTDEDDHVPPGPLCPLPLILTLLLLLVPRISARVTVDRPAEDPAPGADPL